MNKFVMGNHKCNTSTMDKLPGSDVLSHTLRAVDAAEGPAVFKLAVLLHDIGKRDTRTVGDDNEFHFHGHEKIGADMAAKICKRMKLPNAVSDYVAILVREHMFMMDKRTNKRAVKRLMRRCAQNGLVRAEDIANMRKADKAGNMFFQMWTSGDHPGVDRFLKLVEELKWEDLVLTVKDLDINGHDLMDLDFAPGPIFSEILNACLDEVIEERVENTRESLIAFINDKYPVIVAEEDDNE